LSDPDDVVMAARLIRCVRKQRRKFRLKQFADELGNAGRLLDADYNRELLSKLLHMPSSSGPTASGPTSTGATPSTGETSQVSIMDRWGNAISLTQSIERNFGSCIVTPELGFCYNGYLRAFKIKNKKHPYYLRPGTPARSNASPAIVETNGRPRLVIGSTGSERIASGIFCTLMRLFGSDPFTAVDGARIHCTPEGTVYYEDGFVEPVIRSLSAAGFQLKRLERRAFHLGAVQLVVSDDSQFTGVADPRRDGAVVGI
jgi:gamma-glutamyltranspeptidase/glutathione hydrolase